MNDHQRTDAWRDDRAGKITASRFVDVIAKTRDGKPKAERSRYLRQIVFERMAMQPKREITARALEWGSEVEGYARQAYELRTGNIVTLSPFIAHPRYEFIGASPDGLIDEDGGLEMKCPHSEEVHVQTWLEGMPAEHVPQVQGCMLITGRAWWDFVSYDPRQCERLRLYVQRVQRDQALIDEMLAELLQFNAEAIAMQAELARKAA